MAGIFDETRLLTVDDVAEVLGLKPCTVKKWVQNRSIPFLKLNASGLSQKSVVRFNGRRLNQWLDEMSVEPEDSTGKREKNGALKKARKATIDRFNQFAAEV